MKHKYKKYRHLTTSDSFALLEAKDSYASQRLGRASSLQNELAAEYKRVHGLPEDAPIPSADSALLAAATSAAIEVDKTTAQMIAGRARPKAIKSLGFARSELRRALRSLGMVGDSGEAGMNGDNAPPPNATDEQKREWSRRYVESALTQAATK